MNEIDIKYVLNSDEFARESKKVENSISGVERKHTGATENWKEEIELQKKFLKDLEKSYKEQEKAVARMAPGAAQAAALAELRAVKVELEDERQGLELLEAQQKEYEASCVSLRTKIAAVKNEMATLTEGSEEYRKKMKELGDLQDKYGDISKQGSVLADDERAYKAAGEALTGLTGIMSAGTGVAALFGASQENLERIQTRLNAVVAISIGAQQVAQVLNKDSYLRIVALAKGKEWLAIATTKVATALGITNLQAQILMGTLTLGLSVAITGLVLWLNKASKAAEEKRQKLEELKKQETDFATVVANSVAKQLTELKCLQTAWSGLSSEAQKKKFIEDNKKAFDQLGVSVSNVSDAENVLVKNSDALIASLKARAMAAAQVELAAEYYKKVVEKQMAADSREKNITPEDYSKAVDGGLKYTNVTQRGKYMSKNNLLQEAAKNAKAAADVLRADADAQLKTIDSIIATSGKMSVASDAALSGAGIKSAEGTKPNEKKEKTDNTENVKKSIAALNNEVAKAALESEQKVIDTKQAGADKELAQLQLNLKRELQAIKEYKAQQVELYQDAEKKKYIQKTGSDKGFKPQTTKFTQLPEELQNYADNWLTAATDAHDQGAQKVYENVLKDYEQFSSTYINKVSEFESQIKNLKEGGASESEIAGVQGVQAKMLSELDEQMGIKDQVFASWMEQVVNMGLEELLTALTAAQAALDAAQLQGQSDQNTVQLKAQIETLKAQITNEKKEKQVGKGSDPAKKWKNTLSIMNDVKGLTTDIIGNFDGLDDTTKIVLDSAMNIATGVINMIIGITTLAQGSAMTTKVVAEGATESIKGVEKASVILAIIGAALQVIQAIANVLASVFNDDKKKEKEIQRLQVQVDALKAAYEALDKAINKAYSNSAARLIKEQEENLKKQKRLIQEQIRLEEDKKKTDSGKIDEWKNAIKEIDKALEEVQDRVIEALTGSDVKGAIDSLADAYTDAWSGSEDTRAAIKETVRGFIQTAVKELIKSRISPEVQNFMEYLAKAMEDGILSQAEENILDTLEQKIYEKAESLDKGFDKYRNPDEKDNEDSLSGQIRGTIATEQSVAELGGIFRGQWDTTKAIETFLKGDFYYKFIEGIRLQVEIEKNTRRSADNTDKLVEEVKKVKEALETIETNTKPDTGSYGS